MTTGNLDDGLFQSGYTLRKILCIGALLFAIWLVGDASFGVFSALKQHEPSYRIFRSLLEVNLMLFCAAASLSLWKTTIGNETVRLLFFQPLLAQGESFNIAFIMDPQQHHQEWQPAPQDDEDDDNNDANLEDADLVLLHRRGTTSTGGDEALMNNPALLDASYDEYGEVDPRTANDKDWSCFPMPSPMEVTHVALDMLLALLVTLFLFTLSSSRQETNGGGMEDNAFWTMYSRIAAPTFPLLLFLYFLYCAFFPWTQSRQSFWVVVSYTLGAPWCPVSFRDGFLGDVLTSSVRPLKDICFTLFYILFGLKGWWSTQEYRNFDFLGTADANVPEMERSWIVHTVVVSPKQPI